MKRVLQYVGKAVLLELIVMLTPCMVLWFHTGNSRGLQEQDSMTAVQILVDDRSIDVETFLIYMISVDYEPDMEQEALKALAVAARSHLYAHLNWYGAQKLNAGDSSNAIEAEQLEVTYLKPSEMAYSLQQAEPARHWSEIYQEIKDAVEATSGQYLVCSDAIAENQADQMKEQIKDRMDETEEQSDLAEEQSDATEKTTDKEKKNEDTAETAMPVDALWHKISAGTTRFYEGNLTGETDGISLYSPELKPMDGKDGMLAQAVKITLYTRRQLAKLLWEISGTENILEEGTSLSSLFKIEERDDSGYIKELSIGNRKMTGEEAAQLLQISSGCFYVSDAGDSIKIITFGTGTGYGMSLAGASIMASEGADYEEILEYYFPICQIERNLFQFE